VQVRPRTGIAVGAGIGYRWAIPYNRGEKAAYQTMEHVAWKKGTICWVIEKLAQKGQDRIIVDGNKKYEAGQ